MDKIKIVYITTSYPMQTNPSSGIFVQRLITNMPDWVKPLVITPASQSNEAFHSHGKVVPVKVFRYAPKAWQLIAHQPGGIPVALSKNKLLFLMLPFFLVSELLSILLNSFRAQIIHANWSINGFLAGWGGWLLRKPVVTTLRGEDITRATKYKIDHFILRYCIRWSSIIVCVNHSQKNWLRTNFDNVSNKIITIENGVDNMFLKAGNTRNAKGASPESTLRLLAVGSLISRKRINDIIEALNKTKDNKIKLTIAGEGPESDELLRLVGVYQLEERVTFAGTVQPEELISLLKSHDALVLTSESEGRPNVVLEAMAAGLPVLATNLPGITEIITDRVNGLLFEPGRIDQLLDLINYIKNYPEIRLSLGSAAHDYIVKNRLTWNYAAKQYADVYQSLLIQNKRSKES